MRTQFDNDHLRQMQRMKRKKRMKSEKRRQVFFRRILKTGFIVTTVLALGVAAREVVIRYIAQEQEAARNAGKEFLAGSREDADLNNEEVPDRGAGGSSAQGSGNESGDQAAEVKQKAAQPEMEARTAAGMKMELQARKKAAQQEMMEKKMPDRMENQKTEQTVKVIRQPDRIHITKRRKTLRRSKTRLRVAMLFSLTWMRARFWH